MIFLRINLPNFLQFEQYRGKPELLVISFGRTAFNPTTLLVGLLNSKETVAIPAELSDVVSGKIGRL